MTDQPPKARRGCFFYGCLTGLVLLVVLAGGLLVGVHYVKKAVTGMVRQYTDTQAVTLPTVQMSPAETDNLKRRWATFEEGVRAQRPTPPLVLTADEINALIASGPDQHSLKGKVFVSFEGDRVKGDLSLPLQEIGWKMFQGRYLNGSATFSLSLRDGVLFVAPQTITVKGKPVPEMYMQPLRAQNFAAVLTNQPNATAVLQGLQDIEVKDGKLMLVPKAKPGASGAMPERE